MGIKGLWKELQPLCESTHLEQLRGKTLGVDAHGWLHRAIQADPVALAMGQGSGKFIAAFISRVELLLRHGLHIVLVFDGCSMPMKAETDAIRAVHRDVARAKGQEGLQSLHPSYCHEAYSPSSPSTTTETETSSLKSDISDSFPSTVSSLDANPFLNQSFHLSSTASIVRELAKSIQVTGNLVKAVIEVIRKRYRCPLGLTCVKSETRTSSIASRRPRVQLLVAPYEADAQLGFLVREGWIDGVVSEDSDLLAYNCPLLISKLDASGHCSLLELGKLKQWIQLMTSDLSPESLRIANGPLRATALGLTRNDLLSLQSLSTFSYEAFLITCIVSGCDYAKSLPGTGMRKAIRLVASVLASPLSDHSNSSTSQSQTKDEDTSTGTKRSREFSMSTVQESLPISPLSNSSPASISPSQQPSSSQHHHSLLSRVLQALRNQYPTMSSSNFNAYTHRVHKAFYCFVHHLVYHPELSNVIPLHPLPEASETPQKWIGTMLPQSEACQLCETSQLNPDTLSPFGKEEYKKHTRLYWAQVRGGDPRQLGLSTSLKQWREDEQQRRKQHESFIHHPSKRSAHSCTTSTDINEDLEDEDDDVAFAVKCVRAQMFPNELNKSQRSVGQRELGDGWRLGSTRHAHITAQHLSQVEHEQQKEQRTRLLPQRVTKVSEHRTGKGITQKTSSNCVHRNHLPTKSSRLDTVDRISKKKKIPLLQNKPTSTTRAPTLSHFNLSTLTNHKCDQNPLPYRSLKDALRRVNGFEDSTRNQNHR